MGAFESQNSKYRTRQNYIGERYIDNNFYVRKEIGYFGILHSLYSGQKVVPWFSERQN
jgi:hypothetical protein